jgi:hypothetical protein
MATETFFKTIYIDEAAADRIIAEMENPREPYTPKRNAAEVERSGQEWLKRLASKKSSERKTNPKS